MSDTCGCSDDQDSVDEGRNAEPAAWWRVREIQAAMVAGTLLAAGFIAARTGAPDVVSTAANWAALIVGGSTFVPGWPGARSGSAR